MDIIEYEKMKQNCKNRINYCSEYIMQPDNLDNMQEEIVNYNENQKRYLYWLDTDKIVNKGKLPLKYNQNRIRLVHKSQ